MTHPLNSNNTNKVKHNFEGPKKKKQVLVLVVCISGERVVIRLFPLELGLGLELRRPLFGPPLEPLVWVELRKFVPVDKEISKKFNSVARNSRVSTQARGAISQGLGRIQPS